MKKKRRNWIDLIHGAIMSTKKKQSSLLIKNNCTHLRLQDHLCYKALYKLSIIVLICMYSVTH